jgi:hypothetical protein
LVWLADDPEVIFRANTLATKALDYYMKLVGLPYLHKTLNLAVQELYTTTKPCEVDPTRLEKGDDVKKNFANLISYVDKITDCIFNSVDDCPLYAPLFLPLNPPLFVSFNSIQFDWFG